MSVPLQVQEVGKFWKRVESDKALEDWAAPFFPLGWILIYLIYLKPPNNTLPKEWSHADLRPEEVIRNNKTKINDISLVPNTLHLLLFSDSPV